MLQKPRITGWGNGSMTIGSLSKDDENMITAAFAGACWVRVDPDRGLESVSSFRDLPDPVQDEKMHPYWRLPVAGEAEVLAQMKILTLGEIPEHSSVSIAIHSLCGYGYTPENYKTEAEKLISYGFECLRSQRREDGRFTEHWHLSGLFMARGALQEIVVPSHKKSETKQLQVVLDFLAKNVSFGSLDVSVQRLAMRVPD